MGLSLCDSSKMHCGRKKFALWTKNISSADEIYFHCGGIFVSLRWYGCTTAVVLSLVQTLIELDVGNDLSLNVLVQPAHQCLA